MECNNHTRRWKFFAVRFFTAPVESRTKKNGQTSAHSAQRSDEYLNETIWSRTLGFLYLEWLDCWPIDRWPVDWNDFAHMDLRRFAVSPFLCNSFHRSNPMTDHVRMTEPPTMFGTSYFADGWATMLTVMHLPRNAMDLNSHATVTLDFQSILCGGNRMQRN